ncbi:NUDIX hydrolase [Haloplasma contractile]|uniref:NAD+ diphosphatase protein n=1 Tax=Haloplasma contractile SSD-17B TaxID=1033810 RepID=U2FI15_9MOLU|nr:NUDIX domain-containing protein [Haloplasma contractile]ERJ12455.1 NAD+ diphosphatase protein [Haloplasma contractile SSD-17B]
MNLYFKRDQQCFNFKVAAVIRKDNQILLKKNLGDKHYSLPSGSVRFGETTDYAIKRSLFEDLNIKVKVEKLLSINENFFDYQTDEYHEVLFVYLCEVNEEIEVHEYEDFDWHELNKLQDMNLKPALNYHDLKKLPQTIAHNVLK